MNENFDEELSAEEREAFDRLAREKQPPALLETQVIRTLKEAQLLRQPTTHWRHRAPRVVGLLAASLLLFFGGAVVGANWWGTRAPRPGPGSPKFMLVLNSGAPSQPRSLEEVKRIVEEYRGWASGLRQQGISVEGEKLKEEIRIVGEDQTRQQKRISGFFLIGAHDFDEAVQIASGCPHLKYGGTIEVRQIDRF